MFKIIAGLYYLNLQVGCRGLGLKVTEKVTVTHMWGGGQEFKTLHKSYSYT